MKIMLGMLLNLLESLDRMVNEEAQSAIGVLKDLFAKLNGKDGTMWLEMLKKFLRKEPCWVTSAIATIGGCLKKLDLGTVPIPAMPRMKTKDCLKNGITYLDGDFNNWLSGYVPATGGGSLDCFELTDDGGTTYRQMAESLLGTTGSDDELKILLKERGHTFHPEQLADLLRRTKAGEQTGLLMDGRVNLLFIEDEGDVFGCRAAWHGAWDGEGWYVGVNRFDGDFGWIVGARFFSRNKV